MANDDLDTKPESETKTPPAEDNPIRGAFLARQAHADAAAAGAAGDTAPEQVRGAYANRLARETTHKRGDAVAGSEDAGGAVLRGIYAARTTVIVERVASPAAPRRAAAKKAPAKKVAPKRAAVPKAKAKAKAAPARKQRAAAARPKAKRISAPKRAAKKKARRR